MSCVWTEGEVDFSFANSEVLYLGHWVCVDLCTEGVWGDFRCANSEVLARGWVWTEGEGDFRFANSEVLHLGRWACADLCTEGGGMISDL